MSSSPQPPPKKQSFIPPIDPADRALAEHEVEFTFVGVFDDHDDGALRIAHQQHASSQSKARSAPILTPTLAIQEASLPTLAVSGPPPTTKPSHSPSARNNSSKSSNKTSFPRQYARL